MQIQGLSQVHGAQQATAPHAARVAEAPAAPMAAQPSDQLDISEAGQIAARMNEIPDIRQDRVDSIRAALAQGVYETSDKLDAALERLLDEIA